MSCLFLIILLITVSIYFSPRLLGANVRYGGIFCWSYFVGGYQEGDEYKGMSYFPVSIGVVLGVNIE